MAMRQKFFQRMFFRTSDTSQFFPRQLKGVEQKDGQESTLDNFTMMQAFEWYVPADHKHWQRLKNALPDLKATGVDNLWIPPACKGSSLSGNGYDVYDLYDLGEFDCKGGVGTKWGTKQELADLCHDAERLGIGIYFDAVLNHKAGADHTEKCRAVEVDPNGTQSVGAPSS
jgi:alpha-amylase